MGNLHRRLGELGQETLLLEAPTKGARKLIEIAAGVLGEGGDDRVFTHPLLCLTVLPHRARPEREIWTRVNGPYTLMVQPTADHNKVYHGVPHGSKARLILLYLQTEAVKTNSRIVELGTSMRGWLRSMGVSIAGSNYQEVRRQAQKIERALVSFTFMGGDATVSWQDTIIRGSFERPCSDEVRTVELSESFFKAITERPVPVCEAAIRVLGERCMALDLYLWFRCVEWQSVIPTPPDPRTLLMSDARAFRGFRVGHVCPPIAITQRRKNYWGSGVRSPRPG